MVKGKSEATHLNLTRAIGKLYNTYIMYIDKRYKKKKIKIAKIR